MTAVLTAADIIKKYIDAGKLPASTDQHSKKHGNTAEKKFSCLECKSAFITTHTLRLHQQKAKQPNSACEKRRTCGKCKESFSTKEKLDLHITNDKCTEIPKERAELKAMANEIALLKKQLKRAKRQEKEGTTASNGTSTKEEKNGTHAPETKTAPTSNGTESKTPAKSHKRRNTGVNVNAVELPA